MLCGLPRPAGAVLDRAVLTDEHRGEAPGLGAETLPCRGGVFEERRPAVERPCLLCKEVTAQQVALGEAALRSFEQARLAHVAVVIGDGANKRKSRHLKAWESGSKPPLYSTMRRMWYPPTPRSDTLVSQRDVDSRI